MGNYDSEIKQVMDITCLNKKMVEEVVVANYGDVQKSILRLMEEEQKPLKHTNLKVTKKSNYEDLQHDLNLALSEREDFEKRLQRINQEVQKLTFDGDKDSFMLQFDAFKAWIQIATDPTQTLMRVSSKKKT